MIAQITALSVLYGLIGFLVFLGLGKHVLIGYGLIRKICMSILSNEDEDTKYLENKIISKSYLTGSFEKLTTMAITSMFLFEIEKYQYALDVGYLILFLITIAFTYSTQSIGKNILSIFVGASLYMILAWICKIRALNEFNKITTINMNH